MYFYIFQVMQVHLATRISQEQEPDRLRHLERNTRPLRSQVFEPIPGGKHHADQAQCLGLVSRSDLGHEVTATARLPCSAHVRSSCLKASCESSDALYWKCYLTSAGFGPREQRSCLKGLKRYVTVTEAFNSNMNCNGLLDCSLTLILLLRQ